MATKLFTVGNNDKRGNQVGLDCLCTMVTNHGNYGNQIFYLRAKRPKGIAFFRYKGSVDIL
jgi:hypothetical protein